MWRYSMKKEMFRRGPVLMGWKVRITAVYFAIDLLTVLSTSLMRVPHLRIPGQTHFLKLPVARVPSTATLIWAILMMCTEGTQNFDGFVTCRFFMGMLEVFIFVLCAVVTVRWWKKTEQPICVASHLSSSATTLVTRMLRWLAGNSCFWY